MIITPAIKVINDFPDPLEFYYTEAQWYAQHGNNNVILNCSSSKIYYDEHWTPLSIKCVSKGKEFYKLGNMTYAVSSENYLVLNEGCVYSSYIDDSDLAESFTLNFTKNNLSEIISAMMHGSRTNLDEPFGLYSAPVQFIEKLYPKEGVIKNLLDRIQYRVSIYNDGSVVELLYLILAELAQIHTHTNSEIDQMKYIRRSTREELYKRLTMAKDYIQSCYNEDLSLQKIAGVCYLNSYYLLREFKKCFNITPHQYLTKCRLNEAMRLLSHTDLPLQAICNDIGFENVSSFCKLFKSQFQLQPGSFRSRAQS